MKSIRIGSGAGYAGDRLEPALELIEKGQLDYIGFECLAERTIAIGQQNKRKDPSRGYNELLEYRMEKALPLCRKHGVRLITNMGSANPKAAAAKCAQIAEAQGLSGMKIACVTGDDLLPVIDRYMDAVVWETGEALSELPGEVISANAYLGVEGIVKALELGADVVITGRVSDPALFLAPLVYEFGWAMNDWDRLARGTMVGHLLECAAQVTGGYFADPGKKDVPDPCQLGFPIAEVTENGEFFITKLPGTGGMVTPATCAEQITYEIHNPERYITPDVIADFKYVSFRQIENDVVKAEGAAGRRRPDTLKVSVGYHDCFIGEGEISYGGTGCLGRAGLAMEMVRERLERTASGRFDEIKYDLIGCNSLYWNPEDSGRGEPSEVRLRVAGRASDKEAADLIGREVEALYTNGPAGGCGARRQTRDIISIASILVDRREIRAGVEILQVKGG